MKKVLFSLFFLICLCPVFAFNLVNNGVANATVVLGSDATEPEKNAAKEFVLYINKISGANLTIASSPSNSNNIFIGQTMETKKVLGNFDFSQVKDDGIVIKSGKDFLVLAGDRPRGTLYAVFTYLEDYLGCRFWTPEDELVPVKKTISVSKIDKVYNPPFMSRESYFKTNMNPANYKYYVKTKLNGRHQVISDDWGGYIDLIGWCHTIPRLISVEKYGKDHPEWFALRSGKRVLSGHDQVCLTNKEMVAELTKNALEWIKETPNAKLISITQADNYEYCECDNCKKLTEEYGHSGALLTVVNHVAKEVKKLYPDMYVETLAYQYTRQAPKNIKPDDNVIIRLCDIECNFAEPLDSESNKSFYKDLKDWQNYAKQLFIWDYIVNFSNLQVVYPNFQVLQKNIQIFADNNAKAVFAEGDDFNENTALMRLKGWLVAKLLWDPNINSTKATKEFLNGYYGAAGNDMYNYLKIVTKATEREKPNLKCFIPNNYFFNADDYISGFRALNSALKKVENNPVLKNRVLCELYSHQVGWYLAPKDIRNKVANAGVFGKYDTKNKFASMYGDFAKANNNEYVTLGGSIKDSALFVNTLKKDSPPPAECANLPEDKWFDIQENDLNFAVGENEFAKKVDDKDAVNKKAAFMSTDVYNWFIQFQISSILDTDFKYEKIDLYMTYKVIFNGKSENAYHFGIYDVIGKKEILTHEIKSDETKDGKYITKYIGSVLPNTNVGSYIYISPARSAEGFADGLYIDRIFGIYR